MTEFWKINYIDTIKYFIFMDIIFLIKIKLKRITNDFEKPRLLMQLETADVIKCDLHEVLFGNLFLQVFLDL